MAPNDNEMGRMSEAIEGLKKSFDALKSSQEKAEIVHHRDNAEINTKVNNLTALLNEMRMIEAKRQGAESVAKWLIGIIGGVAGAVLSRIVHGM